jgi:glycosyltransferase involved in cell wall biosynthesis
LKTILPLQTAAIPVSEAEASVQPVTVAICAHNEIGNIRTLLEHVLAIEASFLDEVLVVSSGSTDGTDDVVREIAEGSDGRLRLVVEDERQGKVSAVNIVLREAKQDNIILVDADTQPTLECLRLVALALSEPEVGGVGTRNMPVNAGESVAAKVAACMWEAHHYVNLQRPVLGGDTCGIRRVVPEIPSTAVHDDWVLECAIEDTGLVIRYVAEAETLMRVPTTFRDYVRQRRRIHAGYQSGVPPLNRRKATQKPALVLKAFARLLRDQPGRFPYCLLLAAVESYAIMLAWGDVTFHRKDHRVWQMVESTKGALDSRGP